MLTMIQGPENSLMVDLKANPQWALSELRRHGEATLTIDRNTSAWTPEVLNERGGFFVEIMTPFGNFRGVADVPTYSHAGAEIKVRNFSNWLDIRLVGTRTYYGLTPGAIAKEAFHQGLITAVPLTIGSILQAPPIIPIYEFKQQSVLSVVTDMMNLSGQTWEINEDKEISWLARQGKYDEVWLIDDGMLLPKIQFSSLGDSYAETIEKDSEGRSFSAYSYASQLWPQQRVITDASN